MCETVGEEGEYLCDASMCETVDVRKSWCRNLPVDIRIWSKK